tara:strand:- start:375 stop:512 length:138 start_codon:yes stop_codon:yes gene_type:complete
MIDIKFIDTKKDHWKTLINGVDVFGELERSEYRNLIEAFDNKTQH